jgi:hypothetical protein
MIGFNKNKRPNPSWLHTSTKSSRSSQNDRIYTPPNGMWDMTFLQLCLPCFAHCNRVFTILLGTLRDNTEDFFHFGTHQKLWEILYLELSAIIDLYPCFKKKSPDLDPDWVGKSMLRNQTFPPGDLSQRIKTLFYCMLQYPKPPTRANKPLDFILERDPSDEDTFFNASIQVFVNLMPTYNGKLSCDM